MCLKRVMVCVCVCVCVHVCVFTDAMVMDEKVKESFVLDTASAICHYDAHYKDHRKYWCRGYFRDYCNILAFTPNSTDRVVLQDTGNQLIITVSCLTKEDTGWYWCGIQRDFARDDMDFTELVVTDNRRALAKNFWSGKGKGPVGGGGGGGASGRDPQQGALASAECAKYFLGTNSRSPRRSGVNWSVLPSGAGQPLQVLPLESGEEEAVWAPRVLLEPLPTQSPLACGTWVTSLPAKSRILKIRSLRSDRCCKKQSRPLDKPLQNPSTSSGFITYRDKYGPRGGAFF